MDLELTQPPIQWIPGALSLGVKWPGHEAATHLHLVPGLGMCGGSYISIPPYIFIVWCLVKHDISPWCGT